jgi:tetratricopeptide (TPR) repeat protein
MRTLTSLAVRLLAAAAFLAGTFGAAGHDKANGKPFQVQEALTRDDPRDHVLKNSHHKVHPFQMAAGKTYRIDLMSKEFDTYLRLVDPSGAQVAADDDGGEGTNARIIYRAAQAGEHQIIATSFEAGATGKYTLTIVEASSADLLEQEAKTLHARAVALYQRANYPEAIRMLREALAMRRQLYPQAQFPQGHPDLAQSLNNLGSLQQDRGEYAKAQTYYARALAMQHQLYPKSRFPAGHPELAASLNNVGSLLR